MVNFIHHSIICTYLQTVYLTLNVLEKEVIDADYTFLIMHISLVYKTKNKTVHDFDCEILYYQKAFQTVLVNTVQCI